MLSDKSMPRVSAFFGIVIYMYYNDHMPPHFHAEYAEHEAIYEIETLDVTRGWAASSCSCPSD